MTHPRLASVETFRIVPDSRPVREAELRAHLQCVRSRLNDMQFFAEHIGTLIDSGGPLDRKSVDFAQFDAALALGGAQMLVDALAQCRALLPRVEEGEP